MISKGVTSVIVTVTAVEDVDAESDEVFTLSLMSESSLVVIGDPGSVTVTIPENDQPATPVLPSVVTATLSLENLTVPEDEDRTFEIRLSENAPEDLTFTLVGGPVGEYSLSPDPIVISKGVTSVVVTVRALDDTDAESDEVFTLSLMSESSLVVIGDPGSITVTIPENDQPPEATDVEFVVTSALIDEGDEYEIELRLVDSDGKPLSHSRDITVMLEVLNTMETTLSADEYLLDGEQRFSIMVNIPANEITGTVLFQSVDDNADEPDEHITLRISAADQVSWQIGRTLRINVRDDDDPPVVIGFDRDAYRVNERDGTLELTVSVINGVLTETIRLNYAVSDVSTTVSDDYTVSGNTLELSLMTSSVTISVDIIDDTSSESEEEFTVELSGAPAGITLDPAIATVTLTDNEIKASINVSDTDEGETAIVTIELSSPLPTGLASTAVKLVLVNTDDRAADVSGLPMNIVDVLGRSTTAVVMIPLVDDMILEFDEQVELELQVSSELEPLFVKEDTTNNIIASGSFNIIDNEDDTITIVLLDDITPGKGNEVTVIQEGTIYYPIVKLAPGVSASVNITARYRIEFDTTDANGNIEFGTTDANGNVRMALSSSEIHSYGARNGRIRDLTIMAGKNRSVPDTSYSYRINRRSVRGGDGAV